METLSNPQGELIRSWKVFMGKNILLYATKMMGLNPSGVVLNGIVCRGHYFPAVVPLRNKCLLHGCSKERLVLRVNIGKKRYYRCEALLFF